MGYSVVSNGAGRVNEDVVAVYERDGWTDIVLMDGATPLTPERHVRAGDSDPAWFVRQFGADLGAVLDANASQEWMVHAALARTRAAWQAAGGSLATPPWAWPIATLSWVRVRPGKAGATFELYCLGDSKVLLRLPDGTALDLDPFDNPQELATQAAVAALVADGVSDPAARWERLLPMLRTRRAEQNTAVPPFVLCLQPQGAFAARTVRVTAPPGAALVVMSDGLYRLVEPYGVHSDASLLDACVGAGLDALLDQLRRFEAGGAAAGRAAKASDDASAVCWRVL